MLCDLEMRPKTGIHALMSDASTAGCLLTVATMTGFFFAVSAAAGTPARSQHLKKCLEIWFLQIPDCQFISTAAPIMQKWLSASPSKHDKDTLFVLGGSYPRRLMAMGIPAGLSDLQSMYGSIYKNAQCFQEIG
jgi:hypothetical protein